MLREVATRWCNGLLPEPNTQWIGYLSKVNDANQRREEAYRLAYVQEIHELYGTPGVL